MFSLIRVLFAAGLVLAPMPIAAAADTVELQIGYLHRTEHKDTISLLDMPAGNAGLAGAQLGIEDNNTTGTTSGRATTGCASRTAAPI